VGFADAPELKRVGWVPVKVLKVTCEYVHISRIQKLSLMRCVEKFG